MTKQLIPVPFRDTTLFIVDHNGQPHVPMKPVVEGMGLDWAAQFTKLKSNEKRFCIAMIAIQMLGDDQQRNTCCLPLRKLPGWLMTIHANKVKNSLRSTIIAYQNESDEVLWQHWTNHQAPIQQTPIQEPYRPVSEFDLVMQQHKLLGATLQELQAQRDRQAEQQTAIQKIDERLEKIEAEHDVETQYKVQVYDALMQIDPKTGVRIWRIRLRERMKAIGMSQTRLALMLGLSQPSISHYILNRREPGLETMEKIALSIGLTLAEFLSPHADIYTDPAAQLI